MSLPAPRLSRAPLLAAVAASLLTAGCPAPGTVPSKPAVVHVEGTVTPREVSDADFAASLHSVLRDGTPSAQRLGLLIGVVRRQLAHAEQRFHAGHDARGTSSVIGGLYLVRLGEGRKEMIDAMGERALAGAIDRLSPRGDEGRVLALMKMRAAAIPPASPAKAELDQHLAALEQWMSETRTSSPRRPMQRVRAEVRARVARALVDPSEEAIGSAAAAIDAWMAQAMAMLQGAAHYHEMDDVELLQYEIGVTIRMLTALYLRYGDAAGALKHIDETNFKRVILPGFYDTIHGAAVEGAGQARSYAMLAGAFALQDSDEKNSFERDIDAAVLADDAIAAGLWGSALEAYRRNPANFDVCQLLARSLIHFGMPEAAPLVLTEALAARVNPATVSASMELLLGAIADSAEIDDLDAAQRTFKAGAALLAVADRADVKGRVDPSPARVRYVMSSIQIRAGNLGEARALLKAAVAAEPTVSGFNSLALVERQSGDSAAALADVEQAIRAPDARVSLLDVAEAHVTAFELYRDAGAPPDRAKASLDAALAATLAARQQRANASATARAERLLGRILQGYGDTKGATRAFERALQAAASDRPSLGAAMLDAIGRALVRRDLPAARAALKRGLDGDVGEDDLVYGGLWVSLLERELHAPADGSVERSLRAGNKTSWTAKLSAWASGKLSDGDLSTAAESASQRVEAAFYTAMARKVAGDPAAEQRLRAVATAPVIDLLEVQLARDLLAPSVRADLPGGVKLP